MNLHVNVGETKTVRLKRTVDGVDTPIQEMLQWSKWHGFPAPVSMLGNRDGTLSITGLRPGFSAFTATLGGWIPEKFREIGFAVTVGDPGEQLEVVDIAAPREPVSTTYWPGPTFQAP